MLVVIIRALILLYNVSLQFKVYYNLYEIFTYIVQAEVIIDVADLLENETNPIIFSCQATGEPVPSISWYFKGVMINVSDTSKYNISTTLNEIIATSLLTIINAKSSDVGTYTCQAENIIGIDQSSGILTVNGKFSCKVTIYLE